MILCRVGDLVFVGRRSGFVEVIACRRHLFWGNLVWRIPQFSNCIVACMRDWGIGKASGHVFLFNSFRRQKSTCFTCGGAGLGVGVGVDVCADVGRGCEWCGVDGAFGGRGHGYGRGMKGEV